MALTLHSKDSKLTSTIKLIIILPFLLIYMVFRMPFYGLFPFIEDLAELEKDITAHYKEINKTKANKNGN